MHFTSKVKMISDIINQPTMFSLSESECLHVASRRSRRTKKFISNHFVLFCMYVSISFFLLHFFYSSSSLFCLLLLTPLVTKSALNKLRKNMIRHWNGKHNYKINQYTHLDICMYVFFIFFDITKPTKLIFQCIGSHVWCFGYSGHFFWGGVLFDFIALESLLLLINYYYYL